MEKNYRRPIEERTGKTAKELVAADERPDYFDITQFDEIKNLKLGPCKVSDIPEDIRENITDSYGFGQNLASALNYLYEYLEYLSNKGIEIPVDLASFARLRDARTRNFEEVYPLSLESVKSLAHIEDTNPELYAHLCDFAYIEEIRFQIREMPVDIDDFFG